MLQIALPGRYWDLFLNTKMATQNLGYPLCHYLQETEKIKLSIIQVS